MRVIRKEVECANCGHIYESDIYLTNGDSGNEPWCDDIDECPKCGK